jgi:hypothetical protein
VTIRKQYSKSRNQVATFLLPAAEHPAPISTCLPNLKDAGQQPLDSLWLSPDASINQHMIYIVEANLDKLPIWHPYPAAESLVPNLLDTPKLLGRELALT